MPVADLRQSVCVPSAIAICRGVYCPILVAITLSIHDQTFISIHLEVHISTLLEVTCRFLLHKQIQLHSTVDFC